MSIAGEPKSIKNLRSGDLLIQCTKQPHEANLLKMKTFCGLKCTVTPHKSLNTSKGIVRCPALSKQSCEHILEFMVNKVLQMYVELIFTVMEDSNQPTHLFSLLTHQFYQQMSK